MVFHAPENRANSHAQGIPKHHLTYGAFGALHRTSTVYANHLAVTPDWAVTLLATRWVPAVPVPGTILPSSSTVPIQEYAPVWPLPHVACASPSRYHT